MARPLRVLVLRTGEAPTSVAQNHGGFTSMFAEGLRLRAPGVHREGDVEIIEHDVTVHGAHDVLPNPEGFDGAVMTGSAAMVDEDAPWMRYCVRAVRQFLDDETPFLGVCFGHQILGLAVGAEVGRNPIGREMGTHEVELQAAAEDPLFGALMFEAMPDRFAANVSHLDVVLDPKGQLEILGRTAHDDHHIVRAGPRAWGVQFHPEFRAPVMAAYLEARRQKLDEARGHGTTDQRLQDLEDTPEATSSLGRFVGLLERWRESE